YLGTMLVCMDPQRLRVGLPIERFDPLDDLRSTWARHFHHHDKWRLRRDWRVVPGVSHEFENLRMNVLQFKNERCPRPLEWMYGRQACRYWPAVGRNARTQRPQFEDGWPMTFHEMVDNFVNRP